MTQPSFYVHIIESPSPDDLLDGRTEGSTLCSFLQLAQIPCQYNLAVDEARFDLALLPRVVEAVGQLNLPPIIHISAHGDENGIQLTEQHAANTLLTWDCLRGYLSQLRPFLNPPIGLCMSTCGGAYGTKMAAVAKPEDVPIAWIVGTSTKVNFADAALAFSAFYRGLQRVGSESDLMAAMRVASGVSDFKIYYGHVVQQQYSKEQFQRLMQALANYKPQGQAS